MTDAELQAIMQARWMENYWNTTRSFGGGLLTAPKKIEENPVCLLT